MTRDRETARRIAQEVQPLGGSVYYVGGCVRDRLLGRESKDLDIEVHGITPQQLEIVLDRMGGRRTVGASFGVYGLAGCGLDIAMPRREAAVGRGHRDFTVEVDPWLGPERAARRRDFTVNALMEDVLTGQVLDFFGGREDLRRGLLRHVDDRSFPEDPLRVLRGAQFAARFGFSAGASPADSALPLLGAAGFACPRLAFSASIRLTTLPRTGSAATIGLWPLSFSLIIAFSAAS